MIENKIQELQDALIVGEKSGFVAYKLEDIIFDLDEEDNWHYFISEDKHQERR